MNIKKLNISVFVPYDLIIEEMTEKILAKKQDLLNMDNFNVFYQKQREDATTDLIIIECQDKEDITYKNLCADAISFSCDYRIMEREDFAELLAAFNYIPLTIKEGKKVIKETLARINDYLNTGE